MQLDPRDACYETKATVVSVIRFVEKPESGWINMRGFSCCCCCSVPQINTHSEGHPVRAPTPVDVYKCRYTAQGERIACATVFNDPAM